MYTFYIQTFSRDTKYGTLSCIGNWVKSVLI